MCIVEVDRMRGFPTACTTPVEDGMVIQTHTAQVHAVRLEILQLILSEHTSSCLICDEREECRLYSTTIRKAGVTTGCRFCSNDNRCELQDVATYLGLQEIGYPIYYRNLPVETDDPFFDRDYNLCILCGRCVRMCQDVRSADTLAFTQRGRHTVIGPAFNRSHVDAGCEFCGACVSVCPTGALAEKANKWDGKPDREATTTCPLCGIGCQLKVQAKGAMLLGSLPADDPLINHGQLCVKGRFCLPELVNGSQRMLTPYRNEKGNRALLQWEQALDLAAARLSGCAPDDFGMLISPNCSNEDLYVAQKFVRMVMKSDNVDTSARAYYGSAFNAYLKLFARSVPLASLETAPVIVGFGLDARYGRSVVGVELRKAAKRGAKIVTIHPGEHSLRRISPQWIRPLPGTELKVMRDLVRMTGGAAAAPAASGADEGNLSAQLAEVADLLREARTPVFLIGSEFLHSDESGAILEAIDQLAGNTGAGILPLPAQNNLLGALLMGAAPEVLPGALSAADPARRREIERSWGTSLPEAQPGWNSLAISSDRKLKVLYLIGEVLPNSGAVAEFTLFQNIYPPDPFPAADLCLPAAAFGETEGTYLNGEGRLQTAVRLVDPPGVALADWQILCRVAQKMGAPGFDFGSVADVRNEIVALIPELEDMTAVARKCRPVAFQVSLAVSPVPLPPEPVPGGTLPYLLRTGIAEHTYRGFPLSLLVDGAGALFAEGVVAINPKDAARAGIANGEVIILASDHFERVLPARVRPEQPEGLLHALLRHGEPGTPNPHPVTIRKRDV